MSDEKKTKEVFKLNPELSFGKNIALNEINLNLKNITAYRSNTFNTEIFMDRIKNILEKDSTLIPIILGEGESRREYFIEFDEKEIEQYEKKKLQNISKIKRKENILQDESLTPTGKGSQESCGNSEGMDREKVNQKVKEIENEFSLQEVFYLFDILADFVPFRVLRHKYEERRK